MTGKLLAQQYGLEVKHALYHKDGTFYEILTRFPAALFDKNGWVRFDTESEYVACKELRKTEKLNIPEGIATIPGYASFPDRPQGQHS